ncbi:MAG: High-affinity heme uptake system protein IsdE precursor [Deltaproteobacteria bacterium ADurb.Bin510]|nr:MAG: High-affinity heme uptake system protein IsdE precursor [Deltaproteobacteria bacterium ADurb.Bin510]
MEPALVWVGSICVLLAILLPAGSLEAAQAIKVTDCRGHSLSFNQPPQRIVCLIESALSGLYMLGAEQKVVGVSANVYQAPAYRWYAAMDERIRARRLPAPGNWDFVSIESVLALRPDVVIIWSEQTETITALEQRGVKVFRVFINSREDVWREMLALGQLTGRQVRARELIDYSRGELEAIARRTSRIAPARRPSVYYMWAQGNLETSGRKSTVNDLINLAGGRNVCGDIEREHLIVSLEQVLLWNPELIVMWGNDRKDPADILCDPQWKRVRAVQSRNVHELPEVFLCDLWTLKFPYAVKLLAKWSHPAEFADLDLEREKRAMLAKLYGPKILAHRP